MQPIIGNIAFHFWLGFVGTNLKKLNHKFLFIDMAFAGHLQVFSPFSPYFFSTP
jgi:hypothetical protein